MEEKKRSRSQAPGTAAPGQLAQQGQEQATSVSRARDPVGHFHLRNGAAVHSVNWAADLSAKGLRSSYGLMVNYKYDLEDIASNSVQSAHRGDIAVSSAVRGLLSSSTSSSSSS